MCFDGYLNNHNHNSYSCMENFKTKILKHNNKILNNLNPKIQEKTCNCKKEKCPLDNNCLARNIIYKATITTDNTTKFYVGSTSTTLKIDTVLPR